MSFKPSNSVRPTWLSLLNFGRMDPILNLKSCAWKEDSYYNQVSWSPIIRTSNFLHSLLRPIVSKCQRQVYRFQGRHTMFPTLRLLSPVWFHFRLNSPFLWWLAHTVFDLLFVLLLSFDWSQRWLQSLTRLPKIHQLNQWNDEINELLKIKWRCCRYLEF